LDLRKDSVAGCLRDPRYLERRSAIALARAKDREQMVAPLFPNELPQWKEISHLELMTTFVGLFGFQ
jgi:hypothetical protein